MGGVLHVTLAMHHVVQITWHMARLYVLEGNFYHQYLIQIMVSVRLRVCHGSDVTSHLGPYQCMYCERYSDVATLLRYCFFYNIYADAKVTQIALNSANLVCNQNLLYTNISEL